MPENVSPPSPNGQNQEDKKTRFNLYTWLFDNPERFFWVIVLLGILGGLAALMVPNCIDWQISSNNSAESKADEIRQKSISDLRLHILYITGGIIAILTLLQNSWKNQIDRRKIEDDIQKNKNDHIRQVHAERRSRYTKAIEQLGDEKAAVCLGGIYTLVGLIDEWLADNTLKPKERQKEGQVIINNLCSYIRSPFPLAEHRESIEYLKNKPPKYWTENIKNDENKLKEEQEVRQTIFREISLRIEQESTTKKSVGWNGLLYDFSNSEIFYPLSELHFKNPNFSYSKFYGTANFYGSIFIDGANYTLSEFMGDAAFMKSSFRGEISFREAKFYANTWFSVAGDQKAEFYDKAVFTHAKFRKYTDFSGVTFHETDFSSSEFHGNIHFSNTEFTEKVTFQSALFNGEIIDVAGCFNQNPDFHGALFNCNSEYHLSPTKRTIFYICDSPAEITLQTGMQIKKRIPFGSKLFDPNSWDAENQKYTRVSNSATPFDNSSAGEEDKTE